ncbi:MAG: hypothetical protein JW929_01060 [Anaerolineales bacterium]|nr:hypothetical protein [Anaerolineales bacterium]
MYLLGWIGLAAFLRKPSASTERLVKAYFVLCFGWIGIVFFTVFGQQLPAHVAQSVLFLSLAALFGVDLAAGATRYALPAAGWRRITCGSAWGW